MGQQIDMPGYKDTELNDEIRKVLGQQISVGGGSRDNIGSNIYDVWDKAWSSLESSNKLELEPLSESEIQRLNTLIQQKEAGVNMANESYVCEDEETINSVLEGCTYSPKRRTYNINLLANIVDELTVIVNMLTGLYIMTRSFSLYPDAHTEVDYVLQCATETIIFIQKRYNNINSTLTDDEFNVEILKIRACIDQFLKDENPTRTKDLLYVSTIFLRALDELVIVHMVNESDEFCKINEDVTFIGEPKLMDCGN